MTAKNDTIHVAFCINNSFVAPLEIAIYSLACSNPYRPITAHIIYDQLSATNLAKLDRLQSLASNLTIQPTQFTIPDGIKDHITDVHISSDTYTRYYLPEILPDLARVLYLDADILVVGDLAGLWTADLAGNYLGGVKDPYIHSKQVPHLRALGFAADDTYINAGVLLFDLVLARRAKITEKLVRNTDRLFSSGLLRYQDQDGINHTLKGKIQILPNEYNYTSKDFILHRAPAAKHIAIIHYVGPVKPWSPQNLAHEEWSHQIYHAYTAAYKSHLPPHNILLSGWASTVSTNLKDCRATTELRQQVQHLQRDVNSLTGRLSYITDSRTYKLSRKLSSAIHLGKKDRHAP